MMKRMESHPELPPEVIQKPRSCLRMHLLESTQALHALGQRRKDEKAGPDPNIWSPHRNSSCAARKVMDGRADALPRSQADSAPAMADKVNMSGDDVTQLNRSQRGGRGGVGTPTKAEEKLAIPKRKRKRSHPELPQEAIKRPRSGLQRHLLESAQVSHALGKKSDDEKADPSSSRALGNSSNTKGPPATPGFPTTAGCAPHEGAMSNGVYVLPSAANGGVKPVVSSTHLLDFLGQLEGYTPTIPDPVTRFYLNRAGLEAADPRIVRLFSIAAQKFIADIANDALQLCKTKGTAARGSGKYTLTMEDLAAALSKYGIDVNTPPYFT